MRRGALLLAAAGVVFTSVAQAGDRECAAAAESGQLLRNTGKLLEAEAQLKVCADGCPKMVENDCRQWLAEVRQRLATIVVTALDEGGKEVTDVTLKIDGKVAATSLDGRPLALDPGPHKLELERRGYTNVREDVTVKEGEKAHPVSIRFAAATTTAKPVAAPAKPSLVMPIALGALGVAGLATFFVYHISAKSDLDALRADCAPACSKDQVDTVDSKILVSHVALGVGVTALLAGAFVLLYPRLGSPTGSASLRRWSTF